MVGMAVGIVTLPIVFFFENELLLKEEEHLLQPVDATMSHNLHRSQNPRSVCTLGT